jgi:hypothetical protein
MKATKPAVNTFLFIKTPYFLKDNMCIVIEFAEVNI